ncbi:MAG TPA: heme lyase CcmF/NrfE family subunit [Trueperaceae bacterium]|nr:heme lyase CcmF/NrfE family subunit [Trueperaceae bacterium]
MIDLQLGPLGSAAAYLALALAIYGVIAGWVGARTRDARLLTSARLAAVAGFVVATAAIVVMIGALLTDDFSVAYVAQHSRIASPTWVKVVTLWAALEGSVLLWAWLLAGYTALLAVTAPLSALRPYALVVMQAVQVFFFTVVCFLANPFTVLAVPPLDGPGPNELLQNHWMMAVHPLLMYLGFVGLTVPFAYAIAALITRRPGSEWMAQTRRWTLTGWGFLSAAIVAGGWWSYEVLGWGGYWAWDPVENVSLMPWLTATAFIHSVQVQERRRMLKPWNAMLIITTFSLSILGTFLTRSGVVSSVHAFGSGPVGPAFLIFFLVVAGGSFTLLALRWDDVRDRADLDSVVSREGAFLGVNILFLALTFAVLLGTLFPLIVEAISGARVTVGGPFFDQVTLPLWLLVLLLMGIGPLLPWRKADTQSLRRNLAWLTGGLVLGTAVAYALGVHKIYPALTIGLAAYNVVSQVLLLSGALVPRIRLANRPAAAVVRSYAFENRRRVGSMIVHFGVVVIALGVAFSSSYRVDEQIRLDFGASTQFEEYTLTAVDRFMERTPGRISAGAVIDVTRGGRAIARLQPRLNVFGEGRPVPTPAVVYTPWHDVYLNLNSTVGPTSTFVVLRAVKSPLVTWIWVGGFIVVIGTAFSLGSNARRLATVANTATAAEEGARA